MFGGSRRAVAYLGTHLSMEAHDEWARADHVGDWLRRQVNAMAPLASRLRGVTQGSQTGADHRSKTASEPAR